MITLTDLEEAIAECQGQRNPSVNTCIKLAAFYTIRREMQPDSQYSYASAPAENLIEYSSGTEFADAIRGRDYAKVLPIIDEAMTALRVVNPRLYASIIRKLSE